MLDDAVRRLRALEPDLASLVPMVEGAEVMDSGPFRALVSRATAWANLVTPMAMPAGAAEATEALADLRRSVARHGRTPRLVFKEPFFPGLAELLAQAGLTPAEREPLMVCRPDQLRPASAPGVSVRFLRPTDEDDDLAAYQEIWSQALDDGSWQRTPEALAGFRAELERHPRGGAALATLDGRPAGTGFVAVYEAGCEIMRVATAPAARRRGVASAMTDFLAEHGFAAGATLAWLAAATAQARALYERLGFLSIGDELTYFI